MLLRFRTANVRSLRDEQELTFVVSEDEPSPAARHVELPGGAVGVLPLVGIFGGGRAGAVCWSPRRCGRSVCSSGSEC
ncbi:MULTISPECIES: hypothetical protein [unclassified Streptomyces]|uniref:hypothetical protein n=1 Tax=unclassified Streptomyces TaxID=2593676 RepID=UPI0033D659AC